MDCRVGELEYREEIVEYRKNAQDWAFFCYWDMFKSIDFPINVFRSYLPSVAIVL